MKKDLKPLLEANRKIDFFLKKYPNTDYAIDLKFKKDLIQTNLLQKSYLLQNIIFQYKNGFLQLIV